MRISGKKLSFFVFLLFSLTALFNSCAIKGFNNPESKERVYLRQWSYSLDGQNFAYLPNGPLGGLEKYLPDHKGYLTISTEFDLPWQMLSGDVGLALGKIMTASKIYLNGKEIGSSGSFPPEEFSGGQAYTNIKLPNQYLKSTERNTIQVVLWINGMGGISDKPFISSYDKTTSYTTWMSILYSKLIMIFSWSMELTGIVYLIFYANQRKERQYREYGLMSIWTSLYLLPFWQSEVFSILRGVSYLWWIKLLNGTVGIVVCYYATSFMRSFLGVRTPKKMRIVRLTLLWSGIVYSIFIPSVVFFYKNSILFFLFLGLELMFGLSAVMKEIKKKNRQVITLIVGFAPVSFSVFVDFFLKTVLKLSMVPYMTVYGWQMTAITFIAIVTKRYSIIRNQYEYLNENLEKEVKERTQALTKANEELERRQAQANMDMELATHVQKSFYPHDHNFIGWDVAVSFNPLSGVSGDLYDFFVMEGRLRGFGLFDVSGHGISSGLVTMLAKNAIFHAFRTTLPLDLEEAMYVVNNQIISVKGEIENYLTGVLFRIDKENPSSLEFVNAGGPHPIYKSKSKKKNAELLLPNEKKPHYGMLGVNGLDVKFQTIKKKMKAGDVIVLYTDGISETENKNGEPFGKERIMEVLNNKTGTAQEIADAIMEDLRKFVGFEKVNDDITIIVMKKIQEDEPDEIFELEEI